MEESEVVKVKRNGTEKAVVAVRCIIGALALGVFAFYCFGTRGQYRIWEYVLPFVTLGAFAAVGILCAGRLVKALCGEDEFPGVPRKRSDKVGLNFAIIVLCALVLHAVTYLVGVSIYAALHGFPSNWLEQFWRMAWMKNNTDAGHYLNIAENFYVTEGNDQLLLVFFPMFPMLIRALNTVIGNSYVSALAINSAATALTAGMIYLTLRGVIGDRRAKVGAFIALLLPGAIFFNSPMTEPVFMLFTVTAVYLMQNKRYVLAGVLTAFAGFTRSLGVLAAVPLFIIGVSDIAGRIRAKKKYGKTLAKLILGLAVSTFGTLGYLYINYRLHGDPLKFLEYQSSNWSQSACPFFDTPRYMLSYLIRSLADKPENVYSLWIPQFVVIFVSLLIVGATARKLPSAYTVCFLCYFAFAVGCTWLLSSVRYLCAALPFICSIAFLCDKKWKTVAAFSFLTGAYLVYTVMYMQRLAVY